MKQRGQELVCRMMQQQGMCLFGMIYVEMALAMFFPFHFVLNFVSKALLSLRKYSRMMQHQARNIIHGSDGPETAKDEIKLWFKPEELVSYTNTAEKWIYGVN
ncbi:unnamed protein product [Fraxinus pennsylvanica]|uniref:nucleoside-diphosphate kinase n=1 Tax=Fraxinus pennsylvanica TaxID=56036 RepID=A0AAD1YXU6_9LAMI|nr:unnamed protein product [Fraxinus pennsylvanica]